MTRIVTHCLSAARKRAAYARTLSELQRMPLETMHDLDLAPNEFPRLARAALYGR